jgi:putative transposase
LLDTEPEAAVLARLRAAETTGRPLGTEDFVARLEALMRRTLRPQKPGRKAAKADADTTGDLFAGTGE